MAKVARIGDAHLPAEVLRRAEQVAAKIETARRKLCEGIRPEDSLERVQKAAHRRREKQRAEMGASQLDPTLERTIEQNEILSMGVFAEGFAASQAVGQINVRLAGGLKRGTGFLVAPGVLVTNNHVIADPLEAASTLVEFEDIDPFGLARAANVCAVDPNGLFFTDADLDVTFVTLDQEARTRTAWLGWHPLVAQEGKIRIGDAINIIQYPRGTAKSVVMHNSHLLHLENDSELHPFCWYSSDTEQGSSGAPIFNARWEVVAVHHSSIPRRNDRGEIVNAGGEPLTAKQFELDPDRAVYIANEGARVSRIVHALSRAEFESEAHAADRNALLALWEESRVRNYGQQAAREGLTARFTRVTPLGAGAGAGAEALGTVGRAPGGASVGTPCGGIAIHLHFEVKA